LDGRSVTVTATGAPAAERAAAGSAQVEARVLDRASAAASGADGPVLEVPGKQPGAAVVTVDYRSLRNLYGGDWATRLGLVDLSTGTPVRSRNDVAAGRLTASVQVRPTGSRFALTAAASGGTGDYKATSLSPAGSWEVDLHGGGFSWSYKLRTPPVPGGLDPDVALSYSSNGADGRTVSTNNQPSWVGEGWSFWPGYVEREYRGCADDPSKPRTGDLCWATENATMSFHGRSIQLVRDGTSQRWRPKDDDGTRVEQRMGAGNGDVRGEYWVVTTTDGVQYHFGSRPAAQSTWTVPVFGDGPGTGCGGAFATSFCQRAWRWNLDYVVDPHGNTMTYQYVAENNRYARNLTDAAVSTYTRGGYLDHIDYGTRVGDSGSAPGRVLFTTADRCRSGATCGQHTGAAWPDVPWDLDCTGSTCPGKYSPTFWSTRRLATVTTQVLGSAGYRDVDSWRLDHQYPDPGDGTSAGLWLSGIVHTGLVGGSQALPAVTFGGTASANRVNSAADGLPPLDKYRITTIHNGSGGDVNVVYAPVNCSANALPAPATNGLRCFPVRWVPAGELQPRDDWFHTYVVAQVTSDDRVAGDMLEVSNYEYVGAAAWHFDDNPVVPENRRTWSQWRGYEKVRVSKGNTALEPGRPRSSTQYQFFRGMDGDRLSGTGTKTVSITDSTGASLADKDPLAGFLREKITYNGVGGPVVSSEIHDPWTRGPTATQGTLVAYQTEDVRTTTRTTLAAGGVRQTRVDTTFDDEGNPTQVNDLGDVAIAADDRCTRTSHARNTSTWLLNLRSRVTTVGVACSATPSYPDDAISDERTYYDGGALGTAPGAGNATRTEEAASYSGSTPTYAVSADTSYDSYGRVLDAFDGLHRKTSTRYTPATGLATSTAETNALGHTTTTTVEPAWGVSLSIVDANARRTDLAYDPLGRRAAVWLPGRSRSLGQDANLKFAYGVRDDGPSWVRTEALKPNGNYVASYTLLDGFMRTRQLQQPSPLGGRILTDTLYDSRGLTYLMMGPYYESAAPGTALFRPNINQVPAMTLTYFDGAERATDSIFMKLNQEQWRTSTSYGGDNVAVTPPAGGTASRTYSDARDQQTEVRQYHGSTPTGDYDATRYQYTKAGELAVITDAAGNTWRYTYDVRGRRIRALDPDNGTSAMTYDDADEMLTMTDARGTAIAASYDALGRKTALRLGSNTGTLLAEWTYDTLGKGQLTSSTRYQGGNAYIEAVTGYDTAGRPTGESVTVPGVDVGTVAATTFTTTMTYKADGSLNLVRLPALGDLTAETLAYGYDDLGDVTSLKGAAAYLNQAVYTELGELSQIEQGDPAKGPRIWRTSYYEEGTRRLSALLTEREKTGDLRVDRMSDAYDPAGNVLSTMDELVGAAVDNQCFRYDYLRRMTEAWTQTGACATAASTGVVAGPAPYWQSLRYDLTGNRTSQVRHAVGGSAETTVTSTYPAAGQPQPHAVRTVQPGGGAAATYTYDATGNTTGRPGPDGAEQLSWDAQGSLESITAGGRTTGYRYDADGNQLIRHDPGSTTVFVGGGELTIDTATGARKGTRYYGTSGTVAIRTAAGVTWLVADQHGTAELAVDPTTLQATVRRLDPFGNPRGPATIWSGGDRGFVGGTANTNTGLTRLGAREYDPQLGRFLSVDPLIDPDDPQQLNGYAYANNNPASMSDPDGRMQMADGGGRRRARPSSLMHICDSCDYYNYTKGESSVWSPPTQRRHFCDSCEYYSRRDHTRSAWNQRYYPDSERPAVFRASARINAARARAARAARRMRLVNEVAARAGVKPPPEAETLIALGAADGAKIEFRSFSICANVSGGVFVVAGGSICVNFDSVGLTISTEGRFGLEAGGEIDGSVTLRLNTLPADKQNDGIGFTAEGGLKLVAGWGGSGKFQAAYANGEWNHALQGEVAAGGGASLGGAYFTAGHNSGYVKWCDDLHLC
jgi:RHS repeat-associated protein